MGAGKPALVQESIGRIKVHAAVVSEGDVLRDTRVPGIAVPCAKVAQAVTAFHRTRVSPPQGEA